MSKLFITVGYPLGSLYKDTNVYLVENKVESIQLDYLAYTVWLLSTDYRTFDEIVEQAKRYDITDLNLIKEIIDRLIQRGLIIQLDLSDNLPNILSAFENLTFVKQGLGIGYNPSEDGNDYTIVSKNDVKVDLFTYALWCEGNGNNTVSKIIATLCNDLNIDKSESLYNIIMSIMRLYENKIIVFKG